MRRKTYAVALAFLFQTCLLAQDSTGTIVGQVRSAERTPPPGILITAFELHGVRGLARSEAAASATTDAEGRYRLSDVPPGRYAIFINEPYGYSLTAKQMNAAPVALVARGGEVSRDLSLPPAPRGVTVSGRVVKDAIRHELATLFLSAEGRQLQAEVDFEGLFSFRNVPPGDYNLGVTGPQLVWSSKEIRVRDEDIQDVEVRPHPLIPVEGRVVIEGGGPSPRLIFSLSGSSGVARTGYVWVHDAVRSNGMVAVTGWSDRPDDVLFNASLPLGEYRIALTGLPEGYRVKSFTYGATDLLQSPLSLGGELQQLSIVLTTTLKHTKVSGRLIRDIALPRENSSSRLVLQSPSLLTPIETEFNENGYFELSNVPPGRYHVAPNFGSVLTVDEDGVRGVEIRASRVRAVYDEAVRRSSLWRPPVIELESATPAPRVMVAGIIRGEIEPRLYGARLVLKPLNGKDAIDFAFNASMSVPAGDYRVWARGVDDWLYEIQSVTGGAVDFEKESLQITAGDADKEIVLKVALRYTDTVRVRGRVTGATVPVNVQVVLSGNSRLTAHLDVTTGEFEFADVPAGSYSLDLAQSNGLPFDRRSLSKRVIVRDSDVDGIEMPMPSAARTVNGRILVDGRYPVPSVTLSVRPHVDQGPPFPKILTFHSSYGKAGGLVVGPDGRFTIELPVGRHRLRVDGPADSHHLKSVKYGSAELRQDLLEIDEGEPKEIVIRFSEARRSAWVEVKGKVSGLANVRQPVYVALVSKSTRKQLEVLPKKDGSFEFPRIAPDTYTVLTAPRLAGLEPQTIVVTDRDAPFVNLALPGQRRLVVRFPGFDGRPAPGLRLTLTRSKTEAYSIRLDMSLGWKSASEWICIVDVCTPSREKMVGEPTLSFPATPESDRVLTLADGEYQLQLSQVPVGYTLAAFTNGPVNLLCEPLRVGPDMPRDLTIAFSPN